ncbi:hypothetical protein [Pseudoscardovia suis]|uniref:hypothetical protein n=1 Tax=Pseudoscardovia suis TaxID=987063 RepID=UPI0011982AC3|nr:hypothetical protein [Pseudoscardovia suis]
MAQPSVSSSMNMVALMRQHRDQPPHYDSYCEGAQVVTVRGELAALINHGIMTATVKRPQRGVGAHRSTMAL